MASLSDLKEKTWSVDSVTVYMLYNYKEADSEESGRKKELKILKNINKDETEFIQNIKQVIEDISGKKTKIYDYHKEKDEIFEIELKDLENDKNLKYVRKRLEEHHSSRNKIEACKEYPENISFLVLEVNVKLILDNKEVYEKIYCFEKYGYNFLLKKTKHSFLVKNTGKEFTLEEIKEGKVLIFNIKPSCIWYSDKFYMLKNIDGVFNLNDMFDRVIDENKKEIKKILEAEENNLFKTKDEKMYMFRGIKTGGFEKFKILKWEEQKEKLDQAAEKYNQKNNSHEKIVYTEDRKKVDYSKIKNSKFRVELIKCMTNKAALKFLDEELTTSTD